MRDFDPFGGKAFFREELVGEVEVFFEENAKTNALADRGALVGLHQNQAMVARFGQAAQIARVGCFFRHDQADDVDIERPAFRQVGNVQYDVAGARDIEGRPMVDGGQHDYLSIVDGELAGMPMRMLRDVPRRQADVVRSCSGKRIRYPFCGDTITI
jgi:hypothetical protein